MEQIPHLTVQFLPPGSNSTMKEIQGRRKSKRVSFGADSAYPQEEIDEESLISHKKRRSSEDKQEKKKKKKHKSEKQSKESE